MAKNSRVEGEATFTKVREVLIKAVAMSIPTNSMSCFKLPKFFYDELERMMTRFWWG